MKTSLRTLLTIVVVLAATPSHGQMARGRNDAYENYDARDRATFRSAIKDRAGSSTQTQAAQAATKFVPILSAMTKARADLARRLPALHLEMNRQGTAPEIVGTESATQFLTPESSAPRAETARKFVVEQAALFGLTSDQAKALIKFTDYANPSGSMGWVEFRQEANGIPIFQAELRAGFTARGALVRTTSNLVPGLDYASLPTKPALTPAEAAVHGAASIGWTVKAATLNQGAKAESERVTVLGAGPFERPVRTELVYFSAAPGTATLAYAMTLWESVNAYHILVAANDGTLLWRENLTDHQTQPVTYSVYTSDSPGPLSPTNAVPGGGTQGPGVNRTSVTLIADDLNASPLGWITDGGNATIGNNVTAGLDLVSPDGLEGNVTGSGARVFNFAYNPPPLGSDPPTLTNYRNGIVTNIFFWTNRYHDRLWRLGFTEPAGNFQTTNTFNGVDRGGLANDAISAQAQDYAGTNNALFTTPADGTPGRMQLYLYTGPSPQRDSSLDAEIFLHELTHGTSRRLHSALSSVVSRGMGEGWSDFYALCLLSTADEDVNGVFASGAYVSFNLSTSFGTVGTNNYYYGIRRFPYAVKTSLGNNGRPHNPLTLADIDQGKIDLTDGAFPPSPAFSSFSADEVHNIGEVWCMMLLEFRASLINRLGFTIGNERALQIVTDAMKLDPASPNFIQGRDSLLAAANAGPGGADDATDVRVAFALRGAGAGAASTNPLTSGISVSESFSPDVFLSGASFTDTLGNNNGSADPGEDLVLTISLTNPFASALSPITASVFDYTADYGAIAANSTATHTFNYRVPAAAPCGALVSVPLYVYGPGGGVSLSYRLRVGSPVFNLLQNFDGVTPPALPAGWTTSTAAAPGGVAGTPWVTTTANPVDAPNSAFSPDLAGNFTAGGEASLISPAIAIPANGASLSFRHRFEFDSSYDGGIVEIAIPGINGGAFQEVIAAGGSFIEGPYNGSIRSDALGNPLGPRSAFTDTLSAFTTVIALPSSANGKNVQFRWRLGFDNVVGSTGWNVDTITLITYVCNSFDADGDGMPDGFESSFGLNPNNPADAAQDRDGDGLTNLQEYRAGTAPNSAASFLRVTNVGRNPSTGEVTLSFPSINGKVYHFQYNPNIANPLGWSLVYGVVGTGTTVTVSHTVAGTPGYYRLQVLY